MQRTCCNRISGHKGLISSSLLAILLAKWPIVLRIAIPTLLPDCRAQYEYVTGTLKSSVRGLAIISLPLTMEKYHVYRMVSWERLVFVARNHDLSSTILIHAPESISKTCQSWEKRIRLPSNVPSIRFHPQVHFSCRIKKCMNGLRRQIKYFIYYLGFMNCRKK